MTSKTYRNARPRDSGICPYRADKVEEWFLQGLQRLIDPLDGATHTVLIERVQQEQRSNYEDKIRVARTRYARQIEAYTAGLIEMDVLANEKEALDEAIREADKFSVKDKESEIDYRKLEAELVDQVKDVTSAIRELPVNEAKAKLRTLVDKVILYDEEDIEIVLL